VDLILKPFHSLVKAKIIISKNQALQGRHLSGMGVAHPLKKKPKFESSARAQSLNLIER